MARYFEEMPRFRQIPQHPDVIYEAPTLLYPLERPNFKNFLFDFKTEADALPETLWFS
jgi:hypothetical protein